MSTHNIYFRQEIRKIFTCTHSYLDLWPQNLRNDMIDCHESYVTLLGIKLEIPGFAVSCDTNCTMESGSGMLADCSWLSVFLYAMEL